MDKLVTRDWMASFGSIHQKIVHQSELYSEFSTVVEEPGFASGISTTINLSGMTFDHVILRPKNKLLIQDISEEQSIRSAFVLSGHTDSIFSLRNKRSVMETRMHAFQFAPSFEAEHKIISDDFNAVHININPGFFKKLITANTGDFDNLCNSFDKKETFLSQQVLQPRMAELIHYVISCPFQGLTRYLFIESKVLELLALQLEQTISGKPAKELLPEADVDRLYEVNKYIEHNYLEELSLLGLCKMFCLNEFKLKKGYKHLFNTTVFGHIHRLRMEKGKELLSQGIMNVSEVAFFLGYKNVGGFSAEYKKRFGYTPSQLRK